MRSGVSGRLVLVAGATSASGRAVVQALLDSGARVVAVGHDPAKLEALATLGATVEVCDLTAEDAVFDLVGRVHAGTGRVDGVLHLVGGWRGGGGLAAQTEADFPLPGAVAHRAAARQPGLRRRPACIACGGAQRWCRPRRSPALSPASANYTAIKAAAEAWMRAVAQGFAKAASDAGEPLRAASVIFRGHRAGGTRGRPRPGLRPPVGRGGPQRPRDRVVSARRG